MTSLWKRKFARRQPLVASALTEKTTKLNQHQHQQQQQQRRHRSFLFLGLILLVAVTATAFSAFIVVEWRSTSTDRDWSTLRIPARLVLTATVADASPVGRVVRASGASDHVVFAAFLAHERWHEHRSRWRSLLQALPPTFAALPSHTSDAVHTFLAGSHLQRRLRDVEQQRRDDVALLCDVLPHLTLDDVNWALSASLTHAIPINVDNVEGTAIVPVTLRDVVDARLSGTFDVRENALLLRPHERVVDLGSAGAFFVEHGFVPRQSSSANDEFSVRFSGADHQQHLIGSWEREFVLTNTYDHAVQRCLVFLRVSTNDSVVDERNVLAVLMNAVEDKLRRYHKVAETALDTDTDAAPAFAMMKVEMRVGDALLHALTAAASALDGDVDACKTIEFCRRYWDDVHGTSSSSSPEQEGQGVFERLRGWLENGVMAADVSGTVIRDYNDDDDDHRGLHASVPLQAGQTLMRVPLAKIISSRLAAASPIGRELQRASDEHDVELSALCVMAAFIASERALADRSEWATYLATLPTSYAMPIHYSASEVDELQASYTVDIIVEARRQHEREYERLQAAAPQIARRIGREPFLNALHAVNSRNFRVDVGDGETMHILVPWVDMLNHDARKRQTAWNFDADACEFVVVCTKAVTAGEAIYTSYGDQSNSQLFIGYGFADVANPHNMARLQLGAKTFYLRREITALLKQNRFFHYLQLRQEQQGSKNIVLGALAELKESARDGLDAFDTTLEEDKELLAAANRNELEISFRHRMAIIVRLGEKEVLKFWLDSADQITQLLVDSTVDTLDAAVRHLQGLGPRLDNQSL